MPKSSLTRIKILDRALDYCSTHGLGGISIGILSDLLNMSKSGVFAHFKSKENLQLEILEHASLRFVDVVVMPSFGVAAGQNRLEAFVDNWILWGEQTFGGGCIFTKVAAEYYSQPGKIRDKILHLEQQLISTIEKLILSSMQVEQDHQQNVKQFAFEFWGLLNSYFHYTRLVNDERSKERLCYSMEHLYRRIFTPSL